MPLVSDKNTITNYYNYKVFSELYENNVSSFSLSLSSANSLTGEEIKSSEFKSKIELKIKLNKILEQMIKKNPNQ